MHEVSARAHALQPSLREDLTAIRRAAKRELIATRSDKRYVRRGISGRFKESDDVSRSTAADHRTRARRIAERDTAIAATEEKHANADRPHLNCHGYKRDY